MARAGQLQTETTAESPDMPALGAAIAGGHLNYLNSN